MNKAHSDALAAAARSENDLKTLEAALAAQRALTEKIERITSQRSLTAEQINSIVTGLKKVPFANGLVLPEWSSPEVSSLAAQIEEIMDRLKGGGSDDGVMMMPAINKPGLPVGVSIQYFPGNIAGQAFATEFARLLAAQKIPATVQPEDVGPHNADPNKRELSGVVVYKLSTRRAAPVIC